MSWRNHDTHKEETKAVKKALKAVGINATVHHGTGTAWGWLEINIGKGQQFGEHHRDELNLGCYPDCNVCRQMRAMEKRIWQIVYDVTGRDGTETLILRQDDWSQAQYRKTGKGCRPISHPDWKPIAAGESHAI